MKIKYFGYFETAEGTYNRRDFEFSNKKTARKAMRKIAKGKCLVGSTASWCVYDRISNVVASGTVR